MALPARAIEKTRFYTDHEFENMPEFHERYELIEGRLVKKPMPGEEHAQIANFIKEQYTLFDPNKKLGTMFIDLSTNLGPNDTPIPDVAFWTAERKPKRSKGAAPIPDLAIEVLSVHDTDSQKRRDEAIGKVRRYQAAGVRAGWVIDPKARRVEIYRPGQLAPMEILTENTTLENEEMLPGFKIKLSELFDY